MKHSSYATTIAIDTGAQKNRRIVVFFLSTLLALSATMAPAPAHAVVKGNDRVGGKPVSAGAVDPKRAPDIDAAAGILVDESGRALWGRSSSSSRAMASTTKMMTALLTLEKGGLNRKVVVSKRAASQPYGIGLKAGERMSVGKLLELTLVVSSNDAAYALGEYTGGSMPRFVKMMNERAAKLGLKNTHFANPHGLDTRGHYSSPADLARISQEVMKHSAYRNAVLRDSTWLPPYGGRSGRIMKATDKLLGNYHGLLGGKTGFTNNAGFSFVATAHRNGVTLTVVVLGARSNPQRFTQAARLLDWGFRNVDTQWVAIAKDQIGSVPVASTDTSVPVLLGKGAISRVFKLDGSITHDASLTAEAKLPVVAGQQLGTVDIIQGGRVLATLPAIAAKTIISAEETVGAVPVTDYIDRTVIGRAAKADTGTLKMDPAKPVKRVVQLNQAVAAPVDRGQRIGEIRYLQDGKVVAEVPVVSTSRVEKPSFAEGFKISLRRGWLAIIGQPKVAKAQPANS